MYRRLIFPIKDVIFLYNPIRDSDKLPRSVRADNGILWAQSPLMDQTTLSIRMRVGLLSANKSHTAWMNHQTLRGVCVLNQNSREREITRLDWQNRKGMTSTMRDRLKSSDCSVQL